MRYIHKYIGYEVIDGVKFYLTKDKTLSEDYRKAVISESMMYFLERNLEPHVIRVKIK